MLGGLLQIREQELSVEQREDLDSGGMLILAIQGYVGMIDFAVNALPCRMAIISRLSCKRAGTRFNARGINDDGHVSNFVESEFLLYSPVFNFSFVQIRGSVPLFWEQTGVQMTHKVAISRGPESTLPAARKHFEELKERYERIHIVNLLSQKENSSECTLSEAYRLCVSRLTDLNDVISFTGFDFHAIVKRDNYEKLSDLVVMMQRPLESYGCFVTDHQGSLVFTQHGIVRTNCLDCLDRTNVVQTRLARHVLETQLRAFGQYFSPSEEEAFSICFNNIWADNGDWLSKIYAGTGALKSSYTRKGKQTVFGLLDDAAKSVNRFVINNFQDKARQEAIDILLGKMVQGESLLLRNPLHQAVEQEMTERMGEYSYPSKVSLFLGTWNVNGKMLKRERLDDWLTSSKAGKPHLYVIGIQELIELNPGQYITSDTDKLRLFWENVLMRAVNALGGGEYVLLRSIHLVALGLFIFVRADSTSFVRNVETSTKKTLDFRQDWAAWQQTKVSFLADYYMSYGVTMPAGGIGVSLQFNDTKIAFVTAHLAAGQGATEDRNRDFWTITMGLNFRGRRLDDHDMVFWLGDFNYRINMSNEEVRSAIMSQQLQFLYMNDQLVLSRAAGNAFVDFQEAPINFNPTYKYDNGTDIYDTSEKARIPAWTDRVLFKGRHINCREYARGECQMSDHRPVRGVFDIETAIIDHERRDALEKEVYLRRMKSGDSIGAQPVKLVPKVDHRLAHHRPPSTGLLIDLAEPPSPPKPVITAPINPSPFTLLETLDSSMFRDSFPPSQAQVSTTGLPPPSSDTNKWWEREVDEAWIPREGNEKNPFYAFD
ncbi:inositol polyphosphate 5-phosphatase [Rhizophlyctis rosea]|nr:inositol polyphosphate 5-phosphatase [Rhizophlyctis rosea]